MKKILSAVLATLLFVSFSTLAIAGEEKKAGKKDAAMTAPADNAAKAAPADNAAKPAKKAKKAKKAAKPAADNAAK